MPNFCAKSKAVERGSVWANTWRGSGPHTRFTNTKDCRSRGQATGRTCNKHWLIVIKKPLSDAFDTTHMTLH